MKKLMSFLRKLFTNNSMGENPVAVKMFYKISSVKEFFGRIIPKKSRWPVFSGNYQVINPSGQIAICTLTSDHFDAVASNRNNVAIVGTVFTPNLGLEKIFITQLQIQKFAICYCAEKIRLYFRRGKPFNASSNMESTQKKGL